jgi:hypothetical protein
MLDLDFDAEQEMLRDTVRGVCATTARCRWSVSWRTTPSATRSSCGSSWESSTSSGCCSPRSTAGAGMTLIEGVVLYEEFGRSLAPTPHFVSAVLCGGVLARPVGRPTPGVDRPHRHRRGHLHPGVVRTGEQLRSRGRPGPGRARR